MWRTSAPINERLRLTLSLLQLYHKKEKCDKIKMFIYNLGHVLKRGGFFVL